MFRGGRMKAGYKKMIAFLLCMTLSMEGTAVTAWAAEPPAESVSENSQGQPAKDTGENPGEPEEGQESGKNSGDGENSEAGENPGGGENSEAGGEQNPGTEENPGEGEGGGTGENSGGGESGGTEESPAEGDIPEGDADASADDETKEPDEDKEPEESERPEAPEEAAKEQEPEQISENSLETVSENTIATISENHLDTERQGAVKEAEEAFAELLSEKTLMALLYHTDSYTLRSEADEEGRAAAELEIGETLYIEGIEITEDDVWYRARYLLNGGEGVGYVQSYYLAYSDEDWIAWEEEYLRPVLEMGADAYESTAYGIATFSMAPRSVSLYAADTEIGAFPGSYQSALKELKSAHPNWTFVPMKTGLDFQTAVSKEMGAKSLIQKTTSNSSKGWVGDACPSESGWFYATRPAVSYYMDPRNFLTETYIFQFEQLTFNASYHTESAVQTFLNSTFMKGTLPDDSAGRTYAKAFYEIGSGRKLSPIHLASRVYQEQGQGTSGLISGTYPGYEGYYNFFNVGVNGSSTAEKIVKGLTYAKEKGWNSRYKSLEGGAATIGNNYILKGQDTIYLEKFNVNKNSPYGVYEHQYMQNIQAPASESSSTKKMYASAGSLNSVFVFKIPVFNQMPDEGGGTETPEAPLQSISLDKESVTLRRPDTVVEDTTGLSAQEKAENTSTAALQVTFAPADTTSDKTIAWTSSNTKIATVKADSADSSKAVVTAVGTGEVQITAKASKAGNLTAVCQVKVTAPIYRLELSDPGMEEGAEKTTLYAGQSVSLNAEYWPKDTTSDKSITWTSSDEKTAVVRNGKVTAQAAGTAKITAAAAGYSASWDVEVKSCSVVFHQADGTALRSIFLPYGDCIADTDMRELPAAQKLSGRIFRGWYTMADGRGSVFTKDTPVYAQELHIYPHYQDIGGGFYVIPVGDQTYTGSAIKPKVQVFDGTAAPDGSLIGTGSEEVLELVEGKDYTLSYKNNKNVNHAGAPRPTITVKGKGNYTGTQYVYFDILPKALTDHDITAQDITVAYSGKTVKSAPAVYRAGKKLTANKDYTRSYPQTGAGAYNKTGVYPIVITGKGGYTGRITVYETITADILLSKVSVAKIPKQTFTNEQMKKEGGIHPEDLKVTYKKQPLVEGQHYTVSYSNDQCVGKATVTLTAVEGSGYVGSKSVTYQIVGTSIAKAKVEGLENKEYVQLLAALDAGDDAYEREYQKMLQTSGAYSLTLDGRVLAESRDGVTGDYVVSYTGAAKRGAVKAGTATIVFQGINEYSGQLKKTYRILPCELSGDRTGSGRDFTLSYYTQDAPETVKELADPDGITASYVKGGSKPVILLAYQGTPLTVGKDYSISYQNNKAVTAADTAPEKLPSFTVKGKGNFKGTITGTFTVTDGQFDKLIGNTQDNRRKVSMSLKDVVYREKKGAWQTKAVLKDVDGKTLKAGLDYDKNLRYTYEADTEVLVWEGEEPVRARRKAGEPVDEADLPQAGTAIRVTVQGSGPYAGEGKTPEISAVYHIVSADLAKAKVKTAAQTYQDGRPVTLTAADLTVTINGTEGTLVCGVDYVIKEESYSNHTKKGKAKVTLQGIGNYGGEKTITYTIGAKKLWW